MNRISRRSADKVADALLEVGRRQPVVQYDIELGWQRHQHWVRSDAPLPEWASATGRPAAHSALPALIKTIVSVVLLGALAVPVWQARRARQPTAATNKQLISATEPARDPEPSAQGVVVGEAPTAPKPLPVPEPSAATEEPVRRRAVRERRATRAARLPKVGVSGRAPSAQVDAADAAPARSVPTESAAVQADVAQLSPGEVAAAPEGKPTSAARSAPAESVRSAQRPDELLEMQQVAQAEQLLQRAPERALTLVRQGDQRFAHGYFQQERAYIAIMALIRLGRIDEARVRESSFAKQFPALPYGARIRSALEAKSAAP